MIVQTELLDAQDPAQREACVRRAAQTITRGGLVAFSTETVYGLGANARDAGAVRRIFIAKGRPEINPIIVHAANHEAARQLARSWSTLADLLAAHFWPGPLTLVVEAHRDIPREVTGGLDTVGLRVPRHALALALLEAAGTPIAAPSANRSSRISPTTAAHVLRDLSGRVELVLDGGPAPGGIESTVLDLTAQPPRLLRPGLTPPAAIEALIGPIERGGAIDSTSAVLRSPGLLARHYAPQTPLELCPDDGAALVRSLCDAGRRVGWLRFLNEEEAGSRADALGGHSESKYAADVNLVEMRLSREWTACARGLYGALHALDEAGLDRILVAAPPEGDDWLAIRDRLTRAAHA